MDINWLDKLANTMLILYPLSFLVICLAFGVGPNDPFIIKAIVLSFAIYFRYGLLFMFFAIFIKIGIYLIKKEK